MNQSEQCAEQWWAIRNDYSCECKVDPRFVKCTIVQAIGERVPLLFRTKKDAEAYFDESRGWTAVQVVVTTLGASQ